jgi:hypothetical protein
MINMELRNSGTQELRNSGRKERKVKGRQRRLIHKGSASGLVSANPQLSSYWQSWHLLTVSH